MCGIAGFTNFLNSKDRSNTIIEKMLGVIAHRGPDDEGVAHNSFFTFGHRRLSIVDLHGGKQPCTDEYGNILIFNGEIYGYKQLAKRLKQENIQLNNDSDTEVLFSLLNTKGIINTLEMIDGMFAFAYYSAKDNKLYLARDRFGEKPLFYSNINQQLIFASEIKAMRQHPQTQNVSLDASQISSYLTLEYLPGTMTGYESITKLLPGHWLCFNPENKNISIHQYNHVDITANVKHSEQEKLERLKQYLSDSVKQRLIADVPVGVFLSGGLDSSLIAAMAQEHSSNVNSYTIKMPGLSFDESPYAEACARSLGLNHTTIELSTNDVITGLDLIDQKLDEPFADSSLIPSVLLCRYTSQYVKVALGGDGADELFAGYPNFKAQQLAPLMSYLPERLGDIFRRSLKYFPSSDKYMSLSFRLKQLSYGFGLPIEQQSVSWMSAWFAGEQRQLWQPAYKNNINEGLNNLLSELKQRSACKHRIDQLLYIFIHTYLPDDILVKMDRASMYSSLEVRSPFLDKRFSDYVLSLPQEDKIHILKGKYLLKKLAGSYLPQQIIDRKKHGFGFPVSSFIRTHLKERMADIILDKTSPLKDWFEVSQIERYWKEHQSGDFDHGKKLWSLYVLMNVARN